ncbi:DinB family protein [Flavobacterium amniphilum]|uniref:DinB family protein n=1 Tax=Flavobacterium amniphilum TaxID=1834035 RepID=UPI00202A24D5|nr:DinB family protein [Flavobacterium amniphilum]MCL9804403.1 DinB family protein [Flavobacterium amniphilum]
MNFSPVKKTLGELKHLLIQLSDEDYAKSIPNLSGASVGQHTRHIIELFQCLSGSYEEGMLNYDSRERNRLIESSVNHALKALDVIIAEYEKENKSLVIHQHVDGNLMTIETNYYRELLYNLEHCIHHQALIKVALFEIGNVSVTENFGVAPSTIEYKKQCVR